jgi:hypothetical protein
MIPNLGVTIARRPRLKNCSYLSRDSPSTESPLRVHSGESRSESEPESPALLSEISGFQRTCQLRWQLRWMVHTLGGW